MGTPCTEGHLHPTGRVLQSLRSQGDTDSRGQKDTLREKVRTRAKETCTGLHEVIQDLTDRSGLL